MFFSSYKTFDHRDTFKEFQKLLNEQGGYGLTVEGYFGSSVDGAVREHQSANLLTVDGIELGSKNRNHCANI